MWQEVFAFSKAVVVASQQNWEEVVLLIASADAEYMLVVQLVRVPRRLFRNGVTAALLE